MSTTFHCMRGWLPVAAVLLLLVTGPAAARIYQWTDESGETVFSATPPPGGGHEVVQPKYRKVAPPTASPNAPTGQSTPGTDAEKVAEKPDTKKPKEPTAKEKAANCAKAREVRTQLETSRRLRVKNEKGELSYVSEEDRQRRLGEADKSINAWCQ